MVTKKIKAAFVSDCHLGSLTEPKSVLFLKFLNKLLEDKDVTHLFMLGDIFDLWIGRHSYFLNQYKEIVDGISELIDRGIEVHYFEGNHDLYLNDFWKYELGVNVHEGPEEFSLGQLKVRAEHGDQMDPDDQGYIFLRWFLRTPIVRLIIKLFPSWLVVRIGERASAASREYTSNTKTIAIEKAQNKIREHASLKAVSEDWDYLIAGHVHVNEDYEFQINGKLRRVINLGSWMHEPVVFWVDGEKGYWEKLTT